MFVCGWRGKKKWACFLRSLERFLKLKKKKKYIFIPISSTKDFLFVQFFLYNDDNMIGCVKVMKGERKRRRRRRIVFFFFVHFRF